MNTQPFNPEEDMDDIKRWWDERIQPVALQSMISDRGLIVPGVCAAWLYLTDGPFAAIELPIGNPDASPRDVHEGLQLIFQELTEEAADHGAKIIMASPAMGGIGKVLQRVGFIPSETSVMRYIYGV